MITKISDKELLDELKSFAGVTYKTVQFLQDGTMVSMVASNMKNKQLEYKVGHVTSAPEGTAGVFCEDNLGDAVNTMLNMARKKTNTQYATAKRAVLECIPLGERDIQKEMEIFAKEDGYYPSLYSKVFVNRVLFVQP